MENRRPPDDAPPPGLFPNSAAAADAAGTGAAATAPAPLYAGIVVESPLTKVFHYRVPERLHTAIRPGDRAAIVFANRKTRGVVVSLGDRPPIDPKLIRELDGISPPEERIPDELLALTRWTADYYRSGWGATLAAAIPGAVKHGVKERPVRTLRLAVPVDAAWEEADKIAARAPKQAEALRTLTRHTRDNPPGLVTTDDPVVAAGGAWPVWKSLAAKGLVHLGEAEAAMAEAFPEAVREIILSPDQEAAIAAVTPAIAARTFQSFLLHGITGSGKTEVYIRLIGQALAAGRGALVLVPEISLTPQTVSRFQSRFGRLAVMHSNLSAGERARHWRTLCSGEVKLVVGARSAVFAPVQDLGLVVVDEEHERTYKQDNDPRYNARDVAIMRAHRAGAAVVLGSATPSLESYHNARTGKHTLISLPNRAGGAKPPRVEVVDLREEWADVKKPTLFSRRLEYVLGECLKRREQAILFLNRRGFHTSVRCGVCGEAIECPNCDVAMTHHRAKAMLRCGCCGYDQGVPKECPTCGANILRFLGTGTERLEDILGELYPKARLLRMDSDSMSARDAHRNSLAAFSRGEYDILLGTQMVAKGLDFPNVTLVGVLMADGALGMSDFRAPERTFQLVTQVIGRAGRSDKAGKAVVQAFQPDHHAVKFAIAQDYQSFVDAEIPDRLRRGYPPFGRLARVVVSGKDSQQVVERARKIGEACKKTAPEKGRLLGPAACEVERVQGVFRWHMIFFAPQYKTLATWLAAAEVKPGEEKNVRVIIDIDPASMQ